MHEYLLDHLACPACLPANHALHCEITERQQTDIIQATLSCSSCGEKFPIIDGIALFTGADEQKEESKNKYELDDVVSSYLWSHYGDLLQDENWNDAYPHWSKQIQTTPGIGLDLGGAVGRFAFELAQKCDFVVGIDNSFAFIHTARTFFRDGKITVRLKEEGNIYKEETIYLPENWKQSNVEWIVADALRLPFRDNSSAVVASLNLIDKVPHPLQHIQEMDRVCMKQDAQFLLSDPFSWSEEAAPPELWLGGKEEGEYQGFGLDNVANMLTEPGELLSAPWRKVTKNHVWWKIRTHRNHYELIRSCYLKTIR